MTSRVVVGAFVASMIAVVGAACDGNGDGGWYRGGGRGDPCAQYSSCGTCTPVDGCGWCTTGVSQGMCASDPNECASAPAFSWTWNASGCFAPEPDGGAVVASDAGSSSPPSVDAGGSSPIDAASPAPDSGAVLVDAGTPASDAADGSD